MKRTLRLAAGLAAVLLFPFLFSGCPQLVSVSIEDRIDMFLTDLTTDSSRTGIYKNLHPDIQDPWKAPEAWEATDFQWDYHPFDFLGMSYFSSSANGTMTYGGPLSADIDFVMKKDGDDWYILSITVNGVQQVH